MTLRVIVSKFSELRKRSSAETCAVAEPQEERKRWSLQIPDPMSGLRARR